MAVSPLRRLGMGGRLSLRLGMGGSLLVLVTVLVSLLLCGTGPAGHGVFHVFGKRFHLQMEGVESDSSHDAYSQKNFHYYFGDRIQNEDSQDQKFRENNEDIQDQELRDQEDTVKTNVEDTVKDNVEDNVKDTVKTLGQEMSKLDLNKEMSLMSKSGLGNEDSKYHDSNQVVKTVSPTGSPGGSQNLKSKQTNVTNCKNQTTNRKNKQSINKQSINKQSISKQTVNTNKQKINKQNTKLEFAYVTAELVLELALTKDEIDEYWSSTSLSARTRENIKQRVHEAQIHGLYNLEGKKMLKNLHNDGLYNLEGKKMLKNLHNEDLVNNVNGCLLAQKLKDNDNEQRSSTSLFRTGQEFSTEFTTTLASQRAEHKLCGLLRNKFQNRRMLATPAHERKSHSHMVVNSDSNTAFHNSMSSDGESSDPSSLPPVPPLPADAEIVLPLIRRDPDGMDSQDSSEIEYGLWGAEAVAKLASKFGKKTELRNIEASIGLNEIKACLNPRFAFNRRGKDGRGPGIREGTREYTVMKDALADAVKAAADGNTVNINNLPPSALRFTDVSDDFYTRVFLAAVEKWQKTVQEVQERKKETVFKTQLDLILTQIPAESIVFGNFHPHNGDSVYQKIHVFVGVPVVEQNQNLNAHDNIIGRNTTGSSLTVNSEKTRLQLHIAGQPDRSLRFVNKRREFIANNVRIAKNVEAVDVQRSKANNGNNLMSIMVVDDSNGDDDNDDDFNDESESEGDKSEQIANTDTHGNLKTSQPSQISRKKRKQMERQQEKRNKAQAALQKAEEETKNDLFFAQLDEERKNERAKVAEEERAKLAEERLEAQLEFREQLQDPRSPLNVRTQCASIVKEQALELFRLLIREGYETTQPRMQAMKGAIDEVEKWLIEPQFGPEVLRELRIPRYSKTKQDKGITYLKQLAMSVPLVGTNTVADEIGTSTVGANTIAIRGQFNNIKGGALHKDSEQALATLESELAKMRQYLNQLKRLIERYEDSMEDWSDFLADAIRLNAEDNEPEAVRRRQEERDFFGRVEEAMRSQDSEGNQHRNQHNLNDLNSNQHKLNDLKNQNDLNSEFKSCPTGDSRNSYFNHDDSRFMAALPELLLQQYELSNSHAATDVLLIHEFNRLVKNLERLAGRTWTVSGKEHGVSWHTLHHDAQMRANIKQRVPLRAKFADAADARLARIRKLVEEMRVVEIPVVEKEMRVADDTKDHRNDDMNSINGDMNSINNSISISIKSSGRGKKGKKGNQKNNQKTNQNSNQSSQASKEKSAQSNKQQSKGSNASNGSAQNNAQNNASRASNGNSQNNASNAKNKQIELKSRIETALATPSFVHSYHERQEDASRKQAKEMVLRQQVESQAVQINQMFQSFSAEQLEAMKKVGVDIEASMKQTASFHEAQTRKQIDELEKKFRKEAEEKAAQKHAWRKKYLTEEQQLLVKIAFDEMGSRYNGDYSD